MTQPTGARRRLAYTDIPARKRHDGSLEGYRRQRRLLSSRRQDAEGFLPVRTVPGRTQ